MSVPFHISTLKNATVTDERKVSFLRINFYSPNDKAAFGRSSTAAPAIQHALAEFQNQVFVKELVYRSEDARSINDHARQIKQYVENVFSSFEIIYISLCHYTRL
tara:strand:- start:412 stop:726 length:315 start_codon:yes stop_codon:yes gene_type:complete